MRLLVSGASKLMRELEPHPHLGRLITPHDGGSPSKHIWAADNAAFSNWNELSFLKMVEKIKKAENKPLFVAVPDVVCDSVKTRLLFDKYLPYLGELPLAYVLQNGVQVEDIPWELINAVFVGGDDYFKLRRHVILPLLQVAKQKKKHIHVGRVNSIRRISYCRGIGADSIDGTSCSRFPNTYIPVFLKHIENSVNPQQGFGL